MDQTSAAAWPAPAPLTSIATRVQYDFDHYDPCDTYVAASDPCQKNAAAGLATTPVPTPSPTPGLCSGHGKCGFNAALVHTFCTCDKGFKGSRCENIKKAASNSSSASLAANTNIGLVAGISLLLLVTRELVAWLVLVGVRTECAFILYNLSHMWCRTNLPQGLVGYALRSKVQRERHSRDLRNKAVALDDAAVEAMSWSPG